MTTSDCMEYARNCSFCPFVSVAQSGPGHAGLSVGSERRSQ